MKIFVAMLGLVLLLAAAPSVGDTAADWTLAKEADGIRVYTRPVPGSNFDAFRGVVELPASGDRVRALVEDVDHWPEWMYQMREAILLAHIGPGERYSYTVNHLPWPARDRYFIVHSRESYDLLTDTLTVIMQCVDENELPEAVRARLPERDHLVPVGAMSGGWRFRAVAPDRTETVYELHTDPGGRLPAGLVNRLIIDTPFETLRALRERARRAAVD